MGRVSDAVRRSLPSPVVRRMRHLRATTSKRLAGPELDARMDEMTASHAAAMAAAHQEVRRHLEDLTDLHHSRDEDLLAEFLARQDAVLAGYDRRVAALVVRVLDLEEQVRNVGGDQATDGADVNALLDAHHPKGS